MKNGDSIVEQAEKIWERINRYPLHEDAAILIIATALTAQYRAGVEAMRIAAFEPFRHHERIGRMTLWQHLQDAADQLLEERKR